MYKVCYPKVITNHSHKYSVCSFKLYIFQPKSILSSIDLTIFGFLDTKWYLTEYPKVNALTIYYKLSITWIIINGCYIFYGEQMNIMYVVYTVRTTYLFTTTDLYQYIFILFDAIDLDFNQHNRCKWINPSL